MLIVNSNEYAFVTERYQPMRADDVKCSTETYSTAGVSSNFVLPWFWRMVPRDTTESPEIAREKDEEFVAECAYPQSAGTTHN